MSNIAIVVGHDENRQGAFSSYLSKSEYQYNSEVVSHLSDFADIYRRPIKKGYKTAMRELSNIVNRKDYDLVFELHFNASNGKAKGCEALYYGYNDYSKLIAQSFCSKIAAYYGSHNRGAKGRSFADERGYWFLYYIKAPALILEPFFGDNRESLHFADAKEYACVLREWLAEVLQ